MNLFYDLQHIFLCYIIFRLELLNYNGTMTNEIHIKIGEDHGGKSLKLAMRFAIALPQTAQATQ